MDIRGYFLGDHKWWQQSWSANAGGAGAPAKISEHCLVSGLG